VAVPGQSRIRGCRRPARMRSNPTLAGGWLPVEIGSTARRPGGWGGPPRTAQPGLSTGPSIAKTGVGQRRRGACLAGLDAGVCPPGPGPAACCGGRGAQPACAGGGAAVTAPTTAATPRPAVAAVPAGRFPAVLAGAALNGAEARLAGLLDPRFLTEAGWDPVKRVLWLPAEQWHMGRSGCIAVGRASN